MAQCDVGCTGWCLFPAVLEAMLREQSMLANPGMPLASFFSQELQLARLTMRSWASCNYKTAALLHDASCREALIALQSMMSGRSPLWAGCHRCIWPSFWQVLRVPSILLLHLCYSGIDSQHQSRAIDDVMYKGNAARSIGCMDEIQL